MEPSAVFGGQRSQLRTKSPYKRQPSPTPSIGAQSQGYQQSSISEEQRQEEKRGEELRRLIRLRELELNRIGQNKERLIHKIQNTLSMPDPQSSHNYLHTAVHAADISPYKRRNSQSPTIVNHNLRRNSQSPIRIESNPASFSQTFNSSQLSQSLKPQLNAGKPQKEYIQQVFQDNQQLHNRINLISSDLERITIDKQNYTQKLKHVQEQTSNLQRMVRDKDRTELDYHSEIYETKLANKALEDRIHELDHTRNGALFQLNHLQQEKDILIAQNHENTNGLQHKNHFCQDLQLQLDNNQTVFNSQLKQSKEVELVIRQDQDESHEIQQITEQLKREREDLMLKLKQLNDNYEHTVKELTREKQHLEMHNKRHQQLMASKLMLVALEQSVKIKKATTLNEFFQYCKFDQKCHRSLKTLAQVMERVGRYQQNAAIQTWYQNSIDPVHLRKQKGKAVIMFHSIRSKHKFWRIWRSKMIVQEVQNVGKDGSCEEIWKLKVKDVKLEIKRVFRIWRDSTLAYTKRQRCLARLVLRQYHEFLRAALYEWLGYHMEMGSAVRIHILTSQFSHEQLLTIALNQLRYRVKVMKAIRLRRLAHLLKAWRDSRTYRKYIMSQSVACSHLRLQALKRLKVSCFGALRQSKESDKFLTLNHQLTQVVQPAIKYLNSEIEFKSGVTLKQIRLRGLHTIRKQVTCQIQSYFEHWHSIITQRRRKVNKNLREILIRKYSSVTHKAFNLWKLGKQFQTFTIQSGTITGLHQVGLKTQSDTNTVQSQIMKERSRKQTQARVSLTKATSIFNRRVQEWGLHKWHQRAHKLKQMEVEGAAVVVKRLRKQLLRKAWRIYWIKIELVKHWERQDSKCDYYLNTQRLKKKRLILQAFERYITWYQKARSNFSVLQKNMDIWETRNFFKLWADQGNTKSIQLSKSSQNQHSVQFDCLNVQLGKVVKSHELANQTNQQLHKKLTDQAKRILSNAFARFYYIKAERGLKRWIDNVKFQKHHETLLKRTLEHQRKTQWYFVKSSFQNWVAQSRNQECRNAIDKSVFRATEQQQMFYHNREVHQTTAGKLNAEIEGERQYTEMTEIQRWKNIEIIIRKNKDCYYLSKKRYAMDQWSKFTLRQLKFISTIDHVVTKSMWQQGFSNVAAFARDKARTRLQNRAAEGMARMHFKKACSQALSRFRQHKYFHTKIITDSLNCAREVADQNQYTYREKGKDWNGDRGFNITRRAYLLNLLEAWKNVHQWLRTARAKLDSHQGTSISFRARLALKKWNTRAQLTHKLRERANTFNLRKARLYSAACFDGLKQRFYHDKVFLSFVSNLAQKFVNKNKQVALKMIQNFVMSKEACYKQEKEIAARNFESIFNQLFKRRMCRYYQTLRLKKFQLDSRDKSVRAVVGHWNSRNLRRRFQQWCNIHHKQTVCDDVNLEGPVVKEVLREQIRFEACKQFLKDESYTESEIPKITAWANEHQRELLAKSVARLQHRAAGDDQYLKPKMFDRWRMWVKIRKLVRITLRNMEIKLHAGRADLSYAFNRWKYDANILQGVDRDALCLRCVKNTNHQRQLDALEGQAQQVMNEMANTRDELVDSLMGSQRIAISVGRQNQERSLHHGFSQFLDNAQKQRGQNFQEILNDRIDLIEQLKERIMETEADNDSLAIENEELRQFSLDGYAIAKNVKLLSSDRETFSVDLADKASTIRQLLDQNENLQRKLREVTDYSVQLISNSNKAATRLKAATGRY